MPMGQSTRADREEPRGHLKVPKRWRSSQASCGSEEPPDADVRSGRRDVELHLACVDRRARTGRLRSIHRIEDPGGGHHVFGCIEMLQNNGCSLLGIDQHLKTGARYTRRRAVSPLDPGQNPFDAVRAYVGEPDDPHIHVIDLLIRCGEDHNDMRAPDGIR